MEEKNETGLRENGQNENNLINEKITGRKLTVGRLFRRGFVALVCGAVFGGTAAFTFNLVRATLANNMQLASLQGIGETEALPRNIVTLPTNESGAGDTGQPSSSAPQTVPETTDDNIETKADIDKAAAVVSDAAETEDAAQSDAENAAGNDAAEAEDINGIGIGTDEDDTVGEGIGAGGDIADDDEKENESRKDRYETFAERTKEMARAGDSYTVAVNAVTTGTTWFDSTAENTVTYAGLVVGLDDSELLVLTTGDLMGAESLSVTIAQTKVPAEIKQTSATDGLTVLSVSAGLIDGELPEGLTVVDYSSGNTAETGDYIAAVGAPMGIFRSCDFGTIGYIAEDEPAPDRSERVYYSDIRADHKAGTFVLDDKCRLLGIVREPYNENTPVSGLTRIVAIEAFEDIIDVLKNGDKPAYIGIEGVGVSEEMQENGLPEGIYITNVEIGGPAYNAGVKRGDIVYEFNGEEVYATSDLGDILKNIRPESQSALKLMRGSVNSEFQSIEMLLVCGER